MELSLWLADLKGAPVVAISLTPTIDSVRKGELVLSVVGWLQFNYSDEIIIVAKLVESWEMFVLLANVRRVSI